MGTRDERWPTFHCHTWSKERSEPCQFKQNPKHSSISGESRNKNTRLKDTRFYFFKQDHLLNFSAFAWQLWELILRGYSFPPIKQYLKFYVFLSCGKIPLPPPIRINMSNWKTAVSMCMCTFLYGLYSCFCLIRDFYSKGLLVLLSFPTFFFF